MFVLDFSAFLGRFHPVIVHLPIGFILLAILAEAFDRKKEQPNRFVSFGWLMGGFSAIAAAVLGWMLAGSESYSENSLAVHRWLGIGVIVICIIGYWVKRNPERHSLFLHNIINVAMVVVLLGAGHYGGNLTHGSQYLVENAPDFVKTMFNVETVDSLPTYSRPDSTMVFEHLIQPVLDRKCVSCHNEETQRGDLNLVNYQAIMEGGDGGDVVQSGNAQESELFRRVTLPPSSVKYMPPKGDVMTYDEISLLKWWINDGLRDTTKLSEIEVSDEDKSLLIRLFQLDVTPKSWYELVSVDPVDPEVLDRLREAGFSVNQLSQENNFLDIQSVHLDTIEKEDLQLLLDAANHITWLSLPNQNISDDAMEIIGALPNLTKLRLDNNPLTDQGISSIKDLEHLEVLNLYGTQVTDQSLPILKMLPELKELFLWRTGVTAEGVGEADFAEEVNVNLGIGG